MAVDYPAPMDWVESIITYDNAASLLRIIPRVTKSIPYIGPVMAVIDSSFPDEKHKAVMKWFEKLSQKLETDKQELVNLIKMEAINLRYGSDSVTIETAIEYSAAIAEAKDEAGRKESIQSFKEFCSDQKHILALNNLIEGLRANSTLQINILDHYYTYTGGHLRRVRSLAKELLLLVCNGFMVKCMYETLTHDQKFAEENLIKNYTDRMKDVQKNIKSVFEKCRSEHRDNMLNDMYGILDSNVSNSDAVNTLSSLMSEKYDWLENYCIICDECDDMVCCFKGNYVSSSGRNNRFGAVFYKYATETAIDPKRKEEVKNAIESIPKIAMITTEECEKVIDTLRGKGIETHGCAVIRQRYDRLLVPYLNMHSSVNYQAKIETLQEKGSSSAAVHFWHGMSPATRLMLLTVSRVGLIGSNYYLVLL